MSYSISARGLAAAVIASLVASAATEKQRIGSGAEANQIDSQVSQAKEIVEQNAGDGDSVSITISGSVSRSERGYGQSNSVSVTVEKAARADAMNPHATPDALREAKELAGEPAE